VSSKLEDRLKVLRESGIVESSQVRGRIERDEHIYFEIVSQLTDGSRLYVSERWRGEVRLFYAYYWVRDNRVVAGWNNAPHHRDIPTFPHHAHIGGKVLPWKEADLKEILQHIKEKGISRRR